MEAKGKREKAGGELGTRFFLCPKQKIPIGMETSLQLKKTWRVGRRLKTTAAPSPECEAQNKDSPTSQLIWCPRRESRLQERPRKQLDVPPPVKNASEYLAYISALHSIPAPPEPSASLRVCNLRGCLWMDVCTCGVHIWYERRCCVKISCQMLVPGSHPSFHWK